MTDDELTRHVLQKGQELFRPMPWRDDTRPYYVLVSELMLQQTQVRRVIPKFIAFITQFPNEHVLAAASLSEVLTAWQGLGYNRRAKFLHESAKRIVHEHQGIFPNSSKDILNLPGVGTNTLGAIEAYAFNRAAYFIETNIRTVFIHHRFNESHSVTDSEILETLMRVLDHQYPRQFYWALMDYGSWLKGNGMGNNAKSKTYKKQAPLSGSVRQIRGQIISALAASDMTRKELERVIDVDERFVVAIEGLRRDGLIDQTNDVLHLTK